MPAKDVVFEAMKEVLRWVTLTVISWLITQTIAQGASIPEFYTLNIWVFTYLIPLRIMIIAGLTLALRAVDRLIHESPDTKLTGLLPF